MNTEDMRDRKIDIGTRGERVRARKGGSRDGEGWRWRRGEEACGRKTGRGMKEARARAKYR